VSIRRTVKGKRPVFVTGDTDRNMNRLLAIISALSAEVAVLRDRQRTLEQLLSQRTNLSLAEIEAFEPAPADLAERAQWQADFLRRVYYILEREAEEAAKSGRGTAD
jgi:hypothetical protein